MKSPHLLNVLDILQNGHVVGTSIDKTLHEPESNLITEFDILTKLREVSIQHLQRVWQSGRVHRFILCLTYTMFPLVFTSSLLKQCIAIFAVAEGWLMLDIGRFVLFLFQYSSKITHKCM